MYYHSGKPWSINPVSNNVREFFDVWQSLAVIRVRHVADQQEQAPSASYQRISFDFRKGKSGSKKSAWMKDVGEWKSSVAGGGTLCSLKKICGTSHIIDSIYD
ncbi:hypothetical protein [Ruegeria atlantica]|uniref:hypothetical protein n=1 Tax=Ruegeria atlantica TaxID=81569 RepID=UPI0011AE4879|nr:hypothetical protein [Ruegeria atlantica]